MLADVGTLRGSPSVSAPPLATMLFGAGRYKERFWRCGNDRTHRVETYNIHTTVRVVG